jgi:hypothetical protein
MLNLETDERSSLTATIMFELDSWGLNADQLIELIQLPDGIPKRNLRKFRDNQSFPVAEQLDIRLEHLVGIINALRTSYPHNRNMSSFWMKQTNKRFANQSPVAFIVSNGLNGLIAIRKHLDCSYMTD